MERERKRLFTAAQLQRFGDKQRRTIDGYASMAKLRSVVRWKSRLAAAGVTGKAIAEATGREQCRIYEYINFTHEPSDEHFHHIEAAIYNAEKK